MRRLQRRGILYFCIKEKIKINVCSFIIKKAHTLCRLFCLVFDDFYVIYHVVCWIYTFSMDAKHGLFVKIIDIDEFVFV